MKLSATRKAEKTFLGQQVGLHVREAARIRPVRNPQRKRREGTNFPPSLLASGTVLDRCSVTRRALKKLARNVIRPVSPASREVGETHQVEHERGGENRVAALPNELQGHGNAEEARNSGCDPTRFSSRRDRADTRWKRASLAVSRECLRSNDPGWRLSCLFADHPTRDRHVAEELWPPN